MRYPRLIRPGTARDEFSPTLTSRRTLLSMAGVPVRWRDSFLIEYYSERVFPRIAQIGYKAVRSKRWKYIIYLELEGMDELYDLKADPYEMKNLINQPGSKKALAEMKMELQRLLPRRRRKSV